VETIVREASPAGRRASGSTTAPSAARSLGSVADADAPRRPVGIPELDRVLGGGLVGGSLVVLGGEPGIGKSTLVLQAAAAVAAGAPDDHVLYASGEESAGQVRLRAERLGLLPGPAATGVHVAAETDVGRIAELVRSSRPALVIVDSVQTVRVDELDGPAGSVGQVREGAARLGELAKTDGVPIVLVGHVTKDGSLAGPKTLEHLVDVVLGLEGERYGSLRLLRAAKNRFGATDEIGVFEMSEAGLSGVSDPGRAFLVEHPEPAPGSAVAATLEGTRPILVEVQALVSPSGYGTPTRRASGVDPNRLAILIAVLGRRAGISLGGHDVYVSLAGGLAIDDPGLDLPLALALASTARDVPVPAGTAAVGEVGLLGEVRAVPRVESRVREAARLGFARVVVPRSTRAAGRPAAPGGPEVVAVGTVREALEVVIGARP
jgi:DNA repair protein RadA/Sms